MNPIPLFVLGLVALGLSGYARYMEVLQAANTWLATATVIFAIGFAVVLNIKP